MMKLSFILKILFLVSIIAFIAYGIETDCPDTYGYVYCPAED